MRVGIVVVILSVLVLCSGLALATKDLEELKQCEDECKQERLFSEKLKAVCIRKCEDAVKEKKREREKGKEFGGGGENPYVFRDEHFLSKYETQHGRVHVLQRFAEKSELLKGIDRFRVGVIEAGPLTFLSPSHVDADGILYVAQGRGTFTMIQADRGRKSFNIETGDVIRNHAGTPAYLVNKDDSQKLVLVKFVRPVNVPGSFEAFFGPGGQNPESYFKAFSPELLEAAFKVDRERIERIFQKQEGVIMKASREQIQALSHGEEDGAANIWPLTTQSTNPFNLLRTPPTQRNNYGQLFEASPDEFEQLLDLDLGVAYANISRGAMAGPFYNSKATKIAYVVDGEGYFEMACPAHVSGRTKYERVRSQLKRGTAFVVPAGHPVAMVAGRDRNLQVACFAVNAQGNLRYTLAGKKNVMREMEREALELGFGIPGREIEQIFGSQDEDFFFPGPEMQSVGSVGERLG